MGQTHRRRRAGSYRIPGSLIAASLLLLSCASSPEPNALLAALAAPRVSAPAGGYAFFNPPGPRDPWTLRIARWQMRQRAAHRAGLIRPFPKPPVSAMSAMPVLPAPSPVSAGLEPAMAAGGSAGSLAERYGTFMNGRRRQIARQVLTWVQAEAETRFVDDGPIDHWPTLPEVLASDGDDCDGLELLSYHALRQLGFSEDRVYRAILHRARFGQHHMVTLWFEDSQDPWVLDPTATITTRLRRLSELGEWVPLKVFSDTQEYSVSAR